MESAPITRVLTHSLFHFLNILKIEKDTKKLLYNMNKLYSTYSIYKNFELINI